MSLSAEPASPLHLVLTSEADRPRAERLARLLLERRLAACVSLLPVHSLYRWQGGIEADDEVQLLIKTRAEQLEELRRTLLRHHGYDTPEWIHWPAASGGAYGAWLADALSPADDAGPDRAG
jgi:periplasmic divalent cation tolerance protein